MNPPDIEPSGRLSFVLVMALAGLVLFVHPWRASGLNVTPDSIEYAVSAHRFAQLGQYNFEVEGTSYPPRYPPWFSVLCLAPVYALFPGDIGNGILAVFVFALGGAAAAYGIGHRLSGVWGGVMAVVFLVLAPQYRVYSKEILTDVPACALALVGCWLYLRMQESPRGIDYAIAGAVVAGGAALRVLSTAIAVPFLWLALRHRRGALVRLVSDGFLILASAAAVHVFTAAYNMRTFGDWWRCGRNFWRPVPFDYPELLFSRAYVWGNLVWLMAPVVVLSIAWGTAGLLIVYRSRSDHPGLTRSRGLASLIEYALLAGGLPSLIHLFYFYLDLRFHLLVFTLLSIIGGIGLACSVPRRWRDRPGVLNAALALALVLGLVYRCHYNPGSIPYLRAFAESVLQLTPPDSLTIISLEPVYLEHMARMQGKARAGRFIPLSREFSKYAMNIIAPVRIDHPDPYPAVSADIRCSGLLSAGARDVVAFTADERVDQVVEWVRSGRSVFLEVGCIEQPRAFPPLKRLLERLESVSFRSAPWLSRLRVKGPTGTPSVPAQDASIAAPARSSRGPAPGGLPPSSGRAPPSAGSHTLPKDGARRGSARGETR